MSEPDQIDMMDEDELREEFRKALRRIANLEGWNKEMYNNHKIELTRLENICSSIEDNSEAEQRELDLINEVARLKKNMATAGDSDAT